MERPHSGPRDRVRELCVQQREPLDLTRSRTSFTVDADYHYLEGAEYLTIGGTESLGNRAFFTYTDGRLTLISYHNANGEFGRLAIEYDSDGAVVRTLYAPPDSSWSRVIEYFYGDEAPSQTRYYLATSRWEGAALLFDGQLKHNLVRLDYTITDSTGSVARFSEAFTYVYDDRVPKRLPKSMSTPNVRCDYEYALFFMGAPLFGAGNQ